jgi:hypothetical protein
LAAEGFAATTLSLTALDASLFAGLDVEHTAAALFADACTIDRTAETFHRTLKGFAFFDSDFCHSFSPSFHK